MNPHAPRLAPAHRTVVALASVSLAASLTVAACVRVPPSGPLATAAPARVDAVPAGPSPYGDAGYGGGGYGSGGYGDPYGGYGYGGSGYGGHGYGGSGYGGSGYGGYGGSGYGGSGYGGYGYGGSTYGGGGAPAPAMFACGAPADCAVLFRSHGCFPGDPIGVAVAHLADARRTLVRRPEPCGMGGPDYERRARANEGRWSATCAAGRCAVIDHGPRPSPGF